MPPSGDATSAATEHQPQVTTPPEAPASASWAPDELASERQQPSPKPAGEADSNQAPQISARQYLRIKSIYLPRSLHQRLGEHATARKTTRTALILTAVNQTHSQLGSYLATDNTTSGGADGNDLFDIPQHKKDTEPAVQTTIRITDRQHQAIETLLAQFGTNRSQLVVAALTLYLRDNGKVEQI